ncbi:hypothetical protein BC828DRAFT_377089 [Blastocladiella britannica]|nr:hypothetical protein BC828DRAFT_377089 [Blastocladiella britannica]
MVVPRTSSFFARQSSFIDALAMMLTTVTTYEQSGHKDGACALGEQAPMAVIVARALESPFAVAHTSQHCRADSGGDIEPPDSPEQRIAKAARAFVLRSPFQDSPRPSVSLRKGNNPWGWCSATAAARDLQSLSTDRCPSRMRHACRPAEQYMVGVGGGGGHHVHDQRHMPRPVIAEPQPPPPPCTSGIRWSSSKRLLVVHWLIETNACHEAFRFCPETVFLAIQYLDRVMAVLNHSLQLPVELAAQIIGPIVRYDPRVYHHQRPRRSGEGTAAPPAPDRAPPFLLASVCLVIAAKYGEEYVIPAPSLIQSLVEAAYRGGPWVDGAEDAASARRPLVHAAHVVACEWAVLDALEYRLAGIAPSAALFEIMCAAPDLCLGMLAAVPGGDERSAAPLPSSPPSPPPSPPANPPAESTMPTPFTAADGDERWPAMLQRMPLRRRVALTLRSVQIEMIQRLLGHIRATSTAPGVTGLLLLEHVVNVRTAPIKEVWAAPHWIRAAVGNQQEWIDAEQVVRECLHEV